MGVAGGGVPSGVGVRFYTEEVAESAALGQKPRLWRVSPGHSGSRVAVSHPRPLFSSACAFISSSLPSIPLFTDTEEGGREGGEGWVGVSERNNVPPLSSQSNGGGAY